MRTDLWFVTVALLVLHTFSVSAQTIPSGVLPSARSDNATPSPSGRLPGATSVPKRSTPVDADLAGARLTPIEELVAAVAKVNPSLGFIEKVVASSESVKKANEFDRPGILAREVERVRQLAPDEIVIIGKGKIGTYNAEAGILPIEKLDFTQSNKNIDLKFNFLASELISTLRMGPTEARIAVGKLTPDRQVWIKVRAKPMLASADHQPNRTYVSSAILNVGISEYSIASRDGYSERNDGLKTGASEQQWDKSLIVKSSIDQYPPPITVLAGDLDKQTQLLDLETLAILVHQRHPNILTDGDYLQLMINRWLKERQEIKVKMAPDPRPPFFSAYQKLPNAAEIGWLLPYFKEWVRLQALRNDDDFVLVLDAHHSQIQECNSASTLNLGWSSTDQFVASVISKEQLEQIRRRATEAQNRRYNQKQPFTGDGPRLVGVQNLFPTDTGKPNVFFTSACRHPERENGGYLSDLRSALPKEMHPSQSMSAVLIADEWTTRASPHSGASRVTGKVKSISIKSVEAGRSMISAQFEPAVFEFLDYTYGEALPTVVEKFAFVSTSMDVKPTIAQPDQQSSPNQPADIIGLLPGMSLPEARKIIAAHMTVGEELTFRPARKNSQITAFTNGLVFIRDDLKEYILLLNEPGQPDGGILAISRFLYEGPFQIDAAELQASLMQKYRTGKRDWDAYVVFEALEGKPDEFCGLILGGVGGNIEFERNGAPVNTRNLVHQDLRAVASDLSFMLPWVGFKTPVLSDVQKLGQCSTTTVAWMPKSSGLIGGFGVWVIDMKAYGKALQQILAGGGSNGTAKRAKPKL